MLMTEILRRLSRAKKGLSSRKVVRNCLRPHLRITYAATVSAYGIPVFCVRASLR